MKKNVLILERSSQNLKKISDKGKTVLEGVFAEFGIENRNGRIYEEKEYLPHLEYLKNDIENGNLLGELDHPERFEVALSNVSHRVSALWYDAAERQIKGRIEILEGTPKGQIAKSLIDANIPLSISSRAAGTVNEDKSVDIQQIYTYDLVAKPGFENAQLEKVNESAHARIKNQIKQLNESYSKFEKENKNLTSDLGIVDENVSIYDVTDKYPSITLREEALTLVKNKNEEKMENVNEKQVQQWTIHFNNSLSKLVDRINNIENAILEGNGSNKDLETVKGYVEELRGLQEKHLNWTGSIAKGINKVATHSQSLSEKSNQHYKLTKKITDTVDYNAKTLNHTQDWIGNNAKVTNAIAESVDYNAEMLNGINEWNTELAKGVNALHDWGGEKAKAINDMHEWTSSIAKNLNTTASWSEDMFGRAMSKTDAKKLVKYIELVSESKADPKLKEKLNEMLETHGITEKPLNESQLVGIIGVPKLGVITDVKTTGNSKVNVDAGKDSGVHFDSKSRTIIAKIRSGSKIGGGKPSQLKTLDGDRPSLKVGSAGKLKGILTLDIHKSGTKPSVKLTGAGPTAKNKSDQKLKLDQKPVGKLKEDKSSELTSRRSKIDEKLGKIIDNLEKEKKIDEKQIKLYPFLNLLTEGERKEFSILEPTQKEKVAKEVVKNPTTDAGIIRNLWTSALAEDIEDKNPLWMRVAPKKYKKLFENTSDEQKGAIKARAEFYSLQTQYQINNFWETSGLNNNKLLSLNEAVIAKTPEESNKKLDSFVVSVGEAMQKYN
ncbi:MAG: hypothetical protein QQN51_06945 [Nitrosopumilus sp.]